jgi:hypothetical protein
MEFSRSCNRTSARRHIIQAQPSQQRGQPDPGRGQAIALQDALDGPPAGERTDAQGLQLGTDGRGPDQSVAGARHGMEAAAAGQDGPLQFEWDPPWVLVAGPSPSNPACTPAAKLGIPREYPMGVKGNAEES